jgi:hypothetical protein
MKQNFTSFYDHKVTRKEQEDCIFHQKDYTIGKVAKNILKETDLVMSPIKL